MGAASGSLTVNLSSYNFNTAHLKVLDKGLSYVPTPKYLPVSTIIESKDRLIRNIKLKSYFSNSNKPYEQKIKTFTNPSTWTPSNYLIPHSILNTINKINRTTDLLIGESEVRSLKTGKNIKLNERNNLSYDEFKALNEFKNNSNIILKPADKGGATVIMDVENYKAEAYRQLLDTNYYMKLNGPIFQLNIPKIRHILDSMKTDGFITTEQLKFLSGPEEPRPRLFYLLPKIHKDINKWTIPNKMPEGRPIVSDVNSESYRVSQYIESFLTPLSVLHPSYIKNSYDFVSKIRNKALPGNCFIVTGDVSALYTNMLHDRTIQCVKEIFHKYPDYKRPDKHILNLLELILKNNDFKFNNEYFLQTCGTPMGKVMGPALANLYLIDFDYKAMHGFKIKPLLFFRYLDDIFFIWTGTLADLKEYENYLNSLIPGIKLNLTYSETSCNFLDVNVYKKITGDASILQTKVYFKDTDTHQLLHVDSFHPKHTTRGILKSQFLRFKRISSSWEDYLHSSKILFHNLHKRGYSLSLMWDTMKSIWFREEIDKQTIPDCISQAEPLPIILPYNSAGIILAKQYKNILKENTFFDKFKLINSYMMHNNLRKMLIRSELKNNVTQTISIKSFSMCKHPNCVTCKLHIVQESCSAFTSSYYGSSFSVNANTNCRSRNIIYLITCNKCNKQYVGETGRSLGERLSNHRSCIRYNRYNAVGIHFNSFNHSIEDLKVMTIEKIADDENQLTVRKNREIYWQNKLGTLYPVGLNNLPL